MVSRLSCCAIYLLWESWTWCACTIHSHLPSSNEISSTCCCNSVTELPVLDQQGTAPIMIGNVLLIEDGWPGNYPIVGFTMVAGSHECDGRASCWARLCWTTVTPIPSFSEGHAVSTPRTRPTNIAIDARHMQRYTPPCTPCMKLSAHAVSEFQTPS